MAHKEMIHHYYNNTIQLLRYSQQLTYIAVKHTYKCPYNVLSTCTRRFHPTLGCISPTRTYGRAHAFLPVPTDHCHRHQHAQRRCTQLPLEHGTRSSSSSTLEDSPSCRHLHPERRSTRSRAEQPVTAHHAFFVDVPLQRRLGWLPPSSLGGDPLCSNHRP